MLTDAEYLDIKKRLRFVNDLLIDIRETIPSDEAVMLALSIRKIEADVVQLAAAIQPGIQ